MQASVNFNLILTNQKTSAVLKSIDMINRMNINQLQA